MNKQLREEAGQIISASLQSVLPDEAVQKALERLAPQDGKILLVAAGKAAWQMANAAVKALGKVDGALSSQNMAM